MNKKLEGFKKYLDSIDNEEIKEKIEEILLNITEKYKELTQAIKWNQPMFLLDGTFIIGFSYAKGHLSVAPEVAVMDIFREKIEKAGYSSTLMLFRIKWDQKVDYKLLYEIIEYNMKVKKGYKTFWRSPEDKI